MVGWFPELRVALAPPGDSAEGGEINNKIKKRKSDGPELNYPACPSQSKLQIFMDRHADAKREHFLPSPLY